VRSNYPPGGNKKVALILGKLLQLK